MSTLMPATRGEYIDGRLVTPGEPTLTHLDAVGRCYVTPLPVMGPAHRVIIGAAWKPGEDEFGPDVMVIPLTTETIRFTGTPALAIEVLSTNRRNDLVLKLNEYAQAGLPHYWILDPKNRVLLAYALGDGDVYDLIAVVDEHEPREIDFGVATVALSIQQLLGDWCLTSEIR